MEETEVITEVMANPLFRNRVRAIAAIKAHSILGEALPNAQQLAWAQGVVVSGYDAWTEALLMLAETTPATPAAAFGANDATYATVLDTVLARVILAKGL